MQAPGKAAAGAPRIHIGKARDRLISRFAFDTSMCRDTSARPLLGPPKCSASIFPGRNWRSNVNDSNINRVNFFRPTPRSTCTKLHIFHVICRTAKHREDPQEHFILPRPPPRGGVRVPEADWWKFSPKKLSGTVPEAGFSIVRLSAMQRESSEIRVRNVSRPKIDRKTRLAVAFPGFSRTKTPASTPRPSETHLEYKSYNYHRSLRDIT